MSEPIEPIVETCSCVTARSSDTSLEGDRIQFPSKSSSLLSGYDADIDSSAEDAGFAAGVVAENSEESMAHAIGTDNLEGAKEAAACLAHELIADSDDLNTAMDPSSVLDGDNSSSAVAVTKEIEDERVANLRRKRAEADGPDAKKTRN